MKEFDTLDEMWMDAASRALGGDPQGSRDGATTEIVGYAARLNDPRACFLFNPVRKISPSYPAAELIWYMSGTRIADIPIAYAPSYERFTENGSAHGAYGARWHDGDESFNSEGLEAGLGYRSQLWAVVELLRQKQETRQAVLTCWNAGDIIHALGGQCKDIPCTLSLHFIVRRGYLNLIVTMRSNDVYLGMPNDVFAFCHLQMIVAIALGLGVGWYQHQVGSMHVYDRNRDKTQQALECKAFDTGPLIYQDVVADVRGKVEEMVRLESCNRQLKTYFNASDEMLGGRGTLFNQVLLMATSKWTDRCWTDISNHLVKRYVEKYYAGS